MNKLKELAFRYTFEYHRMKNDEVAEFLKLREENGLDICYRCKGEGRLGGETCHKCEGAGMLHVVYTVDFDRARGQYDWKMITVSNAEYREIVSEIAAGDHRHNYGSEDDPDYADTFLLAEEAIDFAIRENEKRVLTQG